MINKKEKGFTLVELLAVIVILAIILVIAVPKVMDIINNAKKGTLESTAKMIASTAEKAKIQNQVLGNTKEIKCEDIVKLNDIDYEACNIEFDGNTAKVTLIGSGKFKGLNVCNGTKTNSSGVNISCSEVCDINEEQKVFNYVKSGYYEVDNISTCEKFIKEKFAFDEAIANESNNLCENNSSYMLGGTLNNLIEISLKEGYFTKEELENYQIVVKPYEVNDVPSCVSYVSTKLNAAGQTSLAAAVEPICNGQEVNGYDFDGAITMIIDNGLFTEEELINANVLKTGKVIKPAEIEEVKVCVPKESMNGVTYLNNMVKDENARKAFGLIKDDTADKNIRYVGFKPSNKVYFNCDEKDSDNVAYGDSTYDYENSCEIWKIIGVFNVKSTENGTAVPRIKIVRDAVLDYVMEWDTIADGIGYVNQWGETTLASDDTTPYNGASLKQYLNGDYYNSLTSIAKGQISNALWYTGAVEDGTAREVYEDERSNQVGTSTEINYTTKWVGKIGLIYTSDFGYAGINCGDKTIGNYVYAETCGEKSNWLTALSHYYWTISSSKTDNFRAWKINGVGWSDACNVVDEYTSVRPSLYLKSDIKIIGGNGGDEPFMLSK